MARRRPYFRGKSRSELEKEIRFDVNPREYDVEFQYPLLSDLILERHYYCSRHGLRPTKFRKDFCRGGAKYKLHAYFPSRGWHPVSWKKCLDPCSREGWIKRALRDAVHPIVSDYKKQHPVCERCRVARSEHVDHVKPEFDEIAKAAFERMSEHDWDEAFAHFDWWSAAPFELPANHPALLHTLDTHKTAELQAVCKSCHQENARDRRNAKA